jgi:hypothetical protein
MQGFKFKGGNKVGMTYAFYATSDNIIYDLGKNITGGWIEYLKLKHHEHLIIPDRYCDLFTDFEEEKEICVTINDNAQEYQGNVIIRIPPNVTKIDCYEDESFIKEYGEYKGE